MLRRCEIARWQYVAWLATWGAAWALPPPAEPTPAATPATGSVAAPPAAATADPDADPVLPSPLQLPQALDVFMRRGFDLLIADAAVASSEGDLTAAGAVPNPQGSGSFGKSFACPSGANRCSWLGPPYWQVGLADQNAIEDIASGKRGLRQNVAREALAAARLNRVDAERTLRAQVKEAFVELLVAQEALRFSLEAKELEAELVRLSQIRYRTGAISEADTARVDTEALEADQAIDSARQALRSAQVSLAFLLGYRRSAPELTVKGDDYLHFALPGSLKDVGASVLVGRALDTRPDLAAQRATRRRAGASLDLAYRQRVPDIGVSVQYFQEGSTASSVNPPTVAVGLTATLPFFYQQQGEIQRAHADVRNQKLQTDKLEAQIVSDVEGAYATFVSTQSRTQRMEGALLARARRARDLVLIQYQKGAASLIELIDAQRTYRGVAQEYREDVAAYWESVFHLEQAIGAELP